MLLRDRCQEARPGPAWSCDTVRARKAGNGTNMGGQLHASLYSYTAGRILNSGRLYQAA